MISGDDNHAVTGSERSQPFAKQLEFTVLLIDKISHQTNKVGRQRRDTGGQFREFLSGEKEADVEVAQQCNAEAIEAWPTSSKLNLDLADRAGAPKQALQHPARRRVLERADTSRYETA
jgi:hypothetical protein